MMTMNIAESKALVPMHIHQMGPLKIDRGQGLDFKTENQSPSLRSMRFIGYNVKERARTYGPSGKSFKDGTGHGAIVDLYV